MQTALDSLLYVAPHINSFGNNVGTVEIGYTVTSVTLTWAFNETMASATITSVGAVSLTSSSQTLTGAWTSAVSWTLIASDGTNTVSATTGIGFSNRRYWGVSPNAVLTSADILALGGSEFAGGFDKSLDYNCSAGDVYPCYAYPAAWGVPSSVTVGGLGFSAFTCTTQSFTNASGYTSSYNVLVFDNPQSSASIAVVWQ